MEFLFIFLFYVESSSCLLFCVFFVSRGRQEQVVVEYIPKQFLSQLAIAACEVKTFFCVLFLVNKETFSFERFSFWLIHCRCSRESFPSFAWNIINCQQLMQQLYSLHFLDNFLLNYKFEQKQIVQLWTCRSEKFRFSPKFSSCTKFDGWRWQRC